MYPYNLGLKFYQLAEEHADKVCLMFSETEQYSFGEVNRLSNQIGKYLLSSDVRPQEVICMAGEKHLYTFATILACLKTGIIYSVFDQDSPSERLRRIFSKCEPKIIFYPDALPIGSLGASEFCKGLHWNSALKQKISQFPAENIDKSKDVTGDYSAYIMFTSGSTGIPKGAVMTHANVINLIEWSCATYKFGPGEVLTNLNPLFFDNSVFDFYSSFYSGATLVPFSKQEVTDPGAVIDKIERCRCTSWFSVPSLLIYLQTMRVFKPSNMSCIRRVIFGGEGYPKARLKTFFDLYKNRIELYNVYGPTECTCICSSYTVSEDDFSHLNGFLPLGRLNENYSYLIVDDNNRQLCQDEVGELCLMGPSVGKGYYNDSDRSRESFIQNPYNDHHQEIMYKTGDLVMVSSQDKKIHIMGRKDNQVKHMGYRIELEEVENAICSLKDIHQVAVVHAIVNELSQLVAFISSHSIVKEHDVRKQLQAVIPAYMMPTRYYFLDRLPTNANGKVDRKKLKDLYY